MWQRNKTQNAPWNKRRMIKALSCLQETLCKFKSETQTDPDDREKTSLKRNKGRRKEDKMCKRVLMKNRVKNDVIIFFSSSPLSITSLAIYLSATKSENVGASLRSLTESERNSLVKSERETCYFKPSLGFWTAAPPKGGYGVWEQVVCMVTCSCWRP